jgi:hypothetical protein
MPRALPPHRCFPAARSLATVTATCSFGFGFAYDDFAALEKNADVSGASKEGQASECLRARVIDALTRDVVQNASAWGILEHDFWGQDISLNTSHKSYRPLTTLMHVQPPSPLQLFSFHFPAILRYRGIHAIRGSHNASMPLYHAASIALHSASTVLAYSVCLSVARISLAVRSASSISPISFSFIAAALFAVHPVHTEAVVNLVRTLPSLFPPFHQASETPFPPPSSSFRWVQPSSCPPPSSSPPSSRTRATAANALPAQVASPSNSHRVSVYVWCALLWR